MQEFTEQFFDLVLDLDENWQVVSVKADYKKKEVEIDIDYIGKKAECPRTFELCGIYDHTPTRRWRHLDLFDFKTYLVCRLPRIKNSNNKVITIIPPWGSKSSRCTNQSESRVIEMLLGTRNQTKTAILMNCSFNQVNRIMHRCRSRFRKTS